MLNTILDILEEVSGIDPNLGHILNLDHSLSQYPTFDNSLNFEARTEAPNSVTVSVTDDNPQEKKTISLYPFQVIKTSNNLANMLGSRQIFSNDVTFGQVESLAQVSSPITLVVDTLLDQNDGSNINGLSLRDAILIANANPTRDYVIQLTSDSIYSLSLTGTGDNESLTGDLDIATGSNITIKAVGTNRATIKADFSGTATDRVFHVLANGKLELENVVVTGGRTTEIRGGGIFNNGGRLTLIDSVVSNNSVSGAFGFGFGGGIFSHGITDLINTSIRDNSASFRGGGIFVENTNRNPLGQSIVTLIGSTVSNNSARRDGGGLFNSFSQLLISNSTINNNSATSGGGVFNIGRLDINNSTISGNSSTGSGGGLSDSSLSSRQTMTISNSTITNNTADSDNNGTGDGGGIARISATIELKNTIVAGNFDTSNNAGTGEIRPDIFGEVTGNNHNLIGNLTGASGSIGTGTDIINAIPGLTPLQDNGGPTLTHALLPGSPAINAGNNSLVSQDIYDLDNDGDTSELVSFDQRGRGFDRIVNGTVDIGAVEVITLRVINGNNQRNYLQGTSGRDQINGLGGEDVILAGDGNDQLNGGSGADLLVGGSGDDILDGGSAVDGLVGGPGADQFLLRSGDGDDIISDYNDGSDKFLLDGLTFNQLGISSAFFNQVTIISIASTGENLATLIGVDASNIGREDFVTL